MKLACVAIVKNEAAHIAEWVAYQFALGFDTVLLFDNLSTDATKANALALARTHNIRVLDWPLRGPDYQLRAYEFAVRHLENRYDWAAFFDTDEFLVLNDGLTLHDGLAARTDSAAVVVPWAIFGASGHSAKPKGLVIENFLYRAPLDFPGNKHVKSIIRPGRMIRAETPHSFIMDGRTTDLAGRNVTCTKPGILDQQPDFHLGKLHHYFTRSWQNWHEKLQRGYPDTSRRLDDFAYNDLNDIYDDGAARLAPDVKFNLTLLATPNPVAKPSNLDFLEQFESIGTNCEFALMQRSAGIEKLGLLRWCTSPPNALIQALATGFEGLGKPENMSIRIGNDEYVVRDLKFGFSAHSWVKPDSIGVAQFTKNTEQRLEFLRRKFMSELANENLIYVYRQSDTQFDPETVGNIAQQIRNAGAGILFWVGQAATCGKPAGSVEKISSNLICGYVARLAPDERAYEIDHAGWHDICRKAYALVNASQDTRAKADA